MKFTVVAEAACNHRGAISQAILMAEKARDAGCDAVKYQFYSPQEIAEYERAHPPSQYTPEILERIKLTQLSLEELIDIKAACDRLGIEFICTPFLTTLRVALLNPLVKRWKIRERDSGNRPLIDACLETGKDVLISATKRPLEDIGLFYHPQIRWLYCLPRYPAKMEELQVDYASTFSGYSNHVPTLAAPLAVAGAAVAKGKDYIIEVHVTLKHGLGVLDEAVSFDFDEVATLVRLLREMEKCPKPLTMPSS